MVFDIRKVPFSRYGSYFCISQDIDSNDIFLRDVHGGDESPSAIFSINLLKDGNHIEPIIKSEETLLTLIDPNSNKNMIEICFPYEDEIHIFIKGLALGLRAKKVKYDTLIDLGQGKYEYHIYPKEIKLMLRLIKGNIKVDAPWNVIGNDYVDIEVTNNEEDYAHFIIEGYTTVSKKEHFLGFEAAKKLVKDEYDIWYQNIPAILDKYKPSKDLASYITWSSVVKKSGMLKEYAMYMSMNWMYSIWSWDNCFNALALAEKNPKLAYSQYKVFFETQDESGVYPDFINEKFASFNCCKPPIFPYFYKKNMGKNDYFMHRLRLFEAYNSFKKMLNYWFEYRTFEGSLPHYNHGNDSGWDNSSIFHEGLPVEAPDLAAHIIKSLDAMAELAKQLNLQDESEYYSAKADNLFKLLMSRLYDEKGFFGRKGYSGEKINNRGSLILLLPIIIGYRLNKEVLDKLVEDLVCNFECTYGLATESYNSELYTKKGYWLGPIWAPVTYLFVDSLITYGYEDIGYRIADKFMNLTLIGGMAENFDPFTGEGLEDPAFTWTSSVFLVLGQLITKNS